MNVPMEDIVVPLLCSLSGRSPSTGQAFKWGPPQVHSSYPSCHSIPQMPTDSACSHFCQRSAPSSRPNKSWDTGSYKGAPRGLSCGHCISSPGVGPDQTSHSRQSRGFAPLGFSQNTQPFHWLERLTRNRAGAACSTHWPALATTAWLLAPAQGRPCPCHSCTVLPAEAKGLGGCKHLRSFKYHWKIYKYTDITYLTSVALEFPYTWLCF